MARKSTIYEVVGQFESTEYVWTVEEPVRLLEVRSILDGVGNLKAGRAWCRRYRNGSLLGDITGDLCDRFRCCCLGFRASRKREGEQANFELVHLKPSWLRLTHYHF